jgi:hypothetical protein
MVELTIKTFITSLLAIGSFAFIKFNREKVFSFSGDTLKNTIKILTITAIIAIFLYGFVTQPDPEMGITSDFNPRVYLAISVPVVTGFLLGLIDGDNPRKNL